MKQRPDVRRRVLSFICGRAWMCALLFLAPVWALGQGYFGTASGTITDSTGAVVAGAKVTLTDQEKGYSFDATTDTTGRYIFRSVPPGLYSVTVDAQGFEKVIRKNLRVSITENATANLALKVSGGAVSIEVQSQNSTLDTEDATTGQVINRKFINDLPLVDRYVMNLTFLAPGVTEMDDQCVNCGGTDFVSNGSRGATADILMDGASVTNFEPNGGVTEAVYTPSPEAVEEFKVQQTNFSAEYGFSGASVINMVTRSGTNQFHGSAYDFIRNQKMDANWWFNNYYGVPIAPIRRNNYGGSVGGPIFKNKTFFFFDWDGTRETTQSSSTAGVPSDAMRGGDFGEVCSENGGEFDENGKCSVAQGQIWDPYSAHYNSTDGGADRSTFVPYNNLATYASPGSPSLNGTSYQLSGAAGDLIDPVAAKTMTYFPEPNISGASIYSNWYGAGPAYNYNDQFDIKIDHRFNDKNLLSGKYSQNWNHYKSFNCFNNFVDPCAGGPNWDHAHMFTLNDTHTFSPTLLVIATLGVTRGSMYIDAYNTDSGVSDPLGTLGFPGYLADSGFTGVPSLIIGGGYYSASETSAGGNPYGNYRQGRTTGQLTLTIDKQLHEQELKFGFEGRINQQNYIQTNAPNGIFNFDTYGSSACPGDYSDCGGDGMASFLMGNVTSGYYEIQIQPASQNYRYAWFAQDNWKMLPNLTLNMGVRYELSLPRTERHNRLNWFDPSAVSPLDVPSLGTLHGGEVFASSGQRSPYDIDWYDVQPRFGFSYQLNPKWVFRGGYGIYFSQTRSGANGLSSYSSEGFNQYTSMITTYGNDGATPYLHLSNPYPNGLNQPPGNSLGLLTDVGYGAVGPIRSMIRTPYAQSWSLGIEHQLPWNVLLNAEYIGKKGTHLYFAGANQLDILGPEIESYTSDQISALQTKVGNPFAGVITDPNSSLYYSTVDALQLQLPYPQFTSVTTDVQPIATSIYHGLQLTAQKNYSNGLQFLVTYTWSKSMDDSSSDDDNVTWLGGFLSLQDPNKPWLERSLSTFDIPQVFQASYTYDLPFGRGKTFFPHMPSIVQAVFGGWKTNGVWRVSEGRPLAFGLADGIALPTYGSQRPNMSAQPKRNHASGWFQNYIANPDVFSRTPDYTLGNTPRTIGSIRTPTAFNVNLSLEKEFSLETLRKGMSLELRAESENAFNHPVFGTPDTSVDDPSFGSITYTSNSPRLIQLGAKVSF